jgi:ligand-binding SRPBCC domain-containing protein
MIAGPFRRMRHDHWFDAENDRTTMRDSFEFSTRLPLLDALVLAPHLRRFLIARNDFIRDVAESDDWRRFLGDRDP